MKDRKRIEAVGGGEQTDSDRIALVQLLAKCGYCVRIVKEKQKGDYKYNRYVEYWEE